MNRFLLLWLIFMALAPRLCGAQDKTLAVRPLSDAPSIVKRALIIGVSNYENANHLPETINDALLFRDLLKTRFGFPDDAITLMTDAQGTQERLRPTYTHLVAMLDSLINSVDNKSELVIFFSGHGARLGDHDYLMPLDGAPGSVQATCIDYDAFKSRLKTKTPARALLFVDACRNLIGKGIEGGIEGGRDLGPQIAELVSCQAKEVSQVGKPQDFHESVFAHFLLQGLEGDPEAVNGQGLVTYDSLKLFVKKRVSNYVASNFGDSQNPDGSASFGSMVLARAAKKATSGGSVSLQAHTKTNPKDGAEMVLIPAGEFTMGSAAEIDALLQANPTYKREWFAPELPQHRVYLDGYYIYKTPVTVKQYLAFCAATGHAKPQEPSWGWKEDHPIVNVSWEDARAYCEWAGAQLPTEAQWEKAARGTNARTYPWGNEWDNSKLQCSESKVADAGSTAAVGSFPSGASPYGVLDMAGNVWQWCADWFDENYYKTSPDRNPSGPASGTFRVLRGGSWYYFNSYSFRCAYRGRYSPGNRYSFFGFRCVVLARP